MKTTIEFLDGIKEAQGFTSDYQLSKFLGCTRGAISSYRMGKSFFDEEMACKVAFELSLDDGYVLACVASERSRNPEVKAAWSHLADRIATLSIGVAAAVLVAFALPFTSADDMQYGLIALSTAPSASTVYYVKWLAENWGFILPLFMLMLWAVMPHHPHPKKEAVKLSDK